MGLTPKKKNQFTLIEHSDESVMVSTTDHRTGNSANLSRRPHR